MVNKILSAKASLATTREVATTATASVEVNNSETLMLSDSWGGSYRLLEFITNRIAKIFTFQWQMFVAAIFLVSVPVFIEAPLVRFLPWLSLACTGFWFYLSHRLMKNPLISARTFGWGDLIFGFGWSWLAGSLYWGWLRWEPLWHLPVEAIGVPMALWCLRRNSHLVGSWFYLGSLFGTVLTDVYFYLVDLIPFWRQIMVAQPEETPMILHAALTRVDTPWGAAWAVILLLVLLFAGLIPLLARSPQYYAFAGAVLSTILVDALFLIAAIVA